MTSAKSELIRELSRRFPLLKHVRGRFGETSRQEEIPLFFALLLAAATSDQRGMCCLVLDKTRGTAAIAAILLAFMRLQSNYPDLVRDYATNALRKGSRVRVKPSNFVYEYAGIWHQYPYLFKLRVLDDDAYRSFPLHEILRLEPTDRVLPKGKLKSALGEFEKSLLDQLLGLTTCGNNSIITNTVLAYMTQAQLAGALKSISLVPTHLDRPDFASLDTYFPWGSIGPGGDLRSKDTYQVIGEPLIATTRVPEDLARAAKNAPAESKIVVVDGARSVVRDIQAFEEAERQRVVVLASPLETAELSVLEGRGCPIWHMPPDAILLGEQNPSERQRTSLVGATVNAADLRRQMRITVVPCIDEALQAVADSLEHAAGLLDSDQDAHEARKILRRLYSVLVECSESFLGVCEETRQTLQAANELVAATGRWLDPKVASAFREAATGLATAIASDTCGDEKADALLEIMSADRHEEWAMAARSGRTANCLREGLVDWESDLPVLPIGAIQRRRCYAGIVLPAWPNRRNFQRLCDKAVTADLRVLAYPFEEKWLSIYGVRDRTLTKSRVMQPDNLSALLDITPSSLQVVARQRPIRFPAEVSGSSSVYSITDVATSTPPKPPPVAGEGEDSRPARLVQFFGGCHALLTDWAELHKLIPAVDGPSGHSTKLLTVSVDDLSQDDAVLFRASGDKEFIRIIAEDELGVEKYGRIRADAERWRQTLRTLGTDPICVRRRLAAFGLSRTIQTISAWLDNPHRIGPQDHSDLVTIAKAAGDHDLRANIPKVRAAISRIRGLHITAGKKLTEILLEELSGQPYDLDDEPLWLDLQYATAWVVRVYEVDSVRQEYPSSSVNQLIWPLETDAPGEFS